MKNSTKRKKRIINAASILLIVIALLMAGACALMLSKPFKEKGSAPQDGTYDSGNVVKAWGGEYCNFLVCGIDSTNFLTDVIMIVSLNNKTGQINILQIPRDTFAGYNVSSYKYNAVYSHHKKDVSGMENLKAHVESDFGIPINYYAAITTKGLRELVDAVGGVDLDVPINMDYDDKAQDLHIHLKKGYQHLDGSEAEQFVRFRKGWAEGDLGRLQAQKSFLAVLGAKLKTMSILSLTTKVVPALMPSNFTTDLTALEMIQFALAAQKIDLSHMAVYTVPGEPFTYKGNALYSVHKEELLKLLNAYFVPEGRTLKSPDLSIKELANTGEESAHNEDGDFETIINQEATSSAKSK